MFSREWRCSRSSAHWQCSNYIWVIKKFIAYKGAIYIRSLTVTAVTNTLEWRFVYITPSVYSDQVFSALCAVLYVVNFVLDFMAMRYAGRMQTGATAMKTTTASDEPIWTADSLHSCKAPSHYLNQCSLVVNWAVNWEQIIVQFESRYSDISRKRNKRCCLQTISHFVQCANRTIDSSYQGYLLQTWIKFNPSMDKYLQSLKHVDRSDSCIPKLHTLKCGHG